MVTGTKNERELALERDLKANQVRLAELEDENRTLKIPRTSRQADDRGYMERWLAGEV